jgi:hypothetical protein
MRSIVRAPLWKANSTSLSTPLSSSSILSPELALAAAQSGIERRAYLNLGYTAKKAILLAFGEIGKIDLFTYQYEAFARQKVVNTPYLKFFIEVMGATRTSRFYEFLVECFGQTYRAGRDRGRARKHRKCRRSHLETLEEVLTGRVIDPPKVRAARASGVAGKLADPPRLTPAEHSDLVGAHSTNSQRSLGFHPGA